MRTTATGLAAAVILLAASAAHAQPAFLLPQKCVPPNPIYYGPGPCANCVYGPNYCFNGPCLPPAPFNGALAFPRPVGNGGPGGPGGPLGFPTHPFAHGPRDFFMIGQQWTE
jgi:hypothetical protein